jgi:hypothetical protein
MTIVVCFALQLQELLADRQAQRSQLELIGQQLATEQQLAAEKEAQIEQLKAMSSRLEQDLVSSRAEESLLREQLGQVRGLHSERLHGAHTHAADQSVLLSWIRKHQQCRLLHHA